MDQVYQQVYLSTMHIDISGALIGGVIGGSLVLSLVSISCSLVTVIIVVLVCRRPTVPGGSVHLEDVNIHAHYAEGASYI